MVVNPLLKDAMQRAGEEMPEDGLLVMSTGNVIACAGSPYAQGAAQDAAVALAPIASQLEDKAARSMEKSQQAVWTDAAKMIRAAISKLKKMPA